MARATGVIVGLTASWIKALTEPALQSAAERILPPSPEQKLEVGADPSGRPENMPPAVLADRAVRAIDHHGLSTPQRLRAQRVIHYGFGAGLGIAYSPPRTAGRERAAAGARWPGSRSTRAATAPPYRHSGSSGHRGGWRRRRSRGS
jgi:hypothetical protein